MKLKNIPPAPGAAVSNPVAEPREQVVSMLAPESEKDFEDSLPSSTAQPLTDKATRKRRTKAEMEAARGGEPGSATQAPTDPVLERAKRKFTSLGAGQTIKAGFVAAKKPLDVKEQEDVDDYFYMVGAKGGLDPTQSWVTMFFCALLLICRLVFMRTDLGEHLKEFLFPEPKAKDKGDEKTSRD